MLSPRGHRAGRGRHLDERSPRRRPDQGQGELPRRPQVRRTILPISSNPGTQGTRYFLNSLFDAPCVEEAGQPNLATWVDGAGGTNGSTATVSVCYENDGPGIAFAAVLSLELPTGASFVAADGGGLLDGGSRHLGPGLAGRRRRGLLWTSPSPSAPKGPSASSPRWTTLPAPTRARWTAATLQLVRFGRVNLLRYGGVVRVPDQLPPSEEIFVAPHPADPALDPARDTEVVAFQSPACPSPTM